MPVSSLPVMLFPNWGVTTQVTLVFWDGYFVGTRSVAGRAEGEQHIQYDILMNLVSRGQQSGAIFSLHNSGHS